jgi:hypothetical protein
MDRAITEDENFTRVVLKLKAQCRINQTVEGTFEFIAENQQVNVACASKMHFGVVTVCGNHGGCPLSAEPLVIIFGATFALVICLRMNALGCERP